MAKRAASPKVGREADSITFRVDDVTPATKPLPEVRAHEALARELGQKPEACWDYNASVVAAKEAHGLLHAIHLAFSQHRPLVLTPDAVWLTIVQGVAHHVQADPERWRSRLVAHAGRLELSVTRDDFAGRSPENPWPEVFSALADLVRDHGRAEVVELIRARFTTTGPVEGAAFDVAILDAFAPYFDYVLVCVCGIPTVTLEGTVADWDDLAARVERLDTLGLQLEWWTRELRPIVGQFARARRGDVDLAHWRAIYKLKDAYGAKQINGWAALLVPYLKDFVTGRPTVRSWMLTKEHGDLGITASSLPTGLASVPLTCVDQDGRARRLLLVAGHVGVEQEANTLALRPKIGWAVVEAPKLDQLLVRLEREHVVRPAGTTWARDREDRRLDMFGGLPAALIQLYDRYDGATLHGRDGLRLLGPGEAHTVCWNGKRFVESGAGERSGMTSYQGRWIDWRSFASLEDGSRLAVDMEGLGRETPPRVIRYEPGKIGPGKCRVVATSIESALERLLDRADPVFDDLGDPFKGQ